MASYKATCTTHSKTFTINGAGAVAGAILMAKAKCVGGVNARHDFSAFKLNPMDINKDGRVDNWERNEFATPAPTTTTTTQVPDSPPDIYCTYCGRPFSSDAARRRHISEVHQSRPDPAPAPDPPAGGTTPTAQPAVDTRTPEQQQSDFFKAAVNAELQAALGNPTELRNFDRMFGIQRPEVEYTAGFQKAKMGFSESAYLKANLDVAAAVSRGQFSSGLDHYLQHGLGEGRRGDFTPPPRPTPPPAPVAVATPPEPAPEPEPEPEPEAETAPEQPGDVIEPENPAEESSDQSESNSDSVSAEGSEDSSETGQVEQSGESSGEGDSTETSEGEGQSQTEDESLSGKSGKGGGAGVGEDEKDKEKQSALAVRRSKDEERLKKIMKQREKWGGASAGTGTDSLAAPVITPASNSQGFGGIPGQR